MRAALTVALLLAALSAFAAEPSDLVVGGKHVTAAELAKVPRVKVTLSEHGKPPSTFEGVELFHLLALAGAPEGEHLRGKELTKVVIVEARDGYRAVYSLAELSPAFSDRKVILADRREGQPLSGEEGPFRIAVEGEKRMARCVRQVTTIRIVDVK